MDKNKITKQINSIVLSNIVPLFDIIDDLENKISSLNISIKDREDKLVILSKQYDEAYFKSVDEQKRTLDEKINLLRKEEEKLNKLRITNERDVNILILEKVKVADSISKLKKDIVRLNKDKEDISKYEIIKSEILDKISSLKKEQFEVNDSINADIESRNKRIKELDKIILDKESEHNTQLEKIIPTLAEIESRRKQVSIRENDVRTIVERYKKLYANQNAGFKV